MELSRGVRAYPLEHVYALRRNSHNDFGHCSRPSDKALLRIEIDRLLIRIDRVFWSS